MTIKDAFKSFNQKQQQRKVELLGKHGVEYARTTRMFTVNVAEQAMIDEWVQSLRSEILAVQRKNRGLDDVRDLLGEDEAYYGAVGGGLTYSFLPTSLGNILTVRETVTGKKLNVCEALDWVFYD